FAGIIPALQSGQIDAAIAGLSITDERKKSVLFSDPYIESGLSILVPVSNTSIQSAADLEGKRVAVQQGSTGAKVADELKAEGKVDSVKYFTSASLMMMEVAKGGVDAVIHDTPFSNTYMASDPGKVRALPEPLASESYAVAFNSKSTELQAQVDQAIKELTADGTIERLKAKYFGDDQSGSASVFSDYFRNIVTVMPHLLKGATYTIGTAGISEIIAIGLGLALALGRLFGNRPLQLVVIGYVDIIRGTPLLVQILFIYFGIPSLINSVTGHPANINPFLAGIIAFSLNGAAYLSEIFRAGINSVDKGQWEAAYSLGFSRRGTFFTVILPQAFRQSIPPMGNDFITLVKDTSLLSVIAVTEITMEGQNYIARTYAAFPTYIAIAFTYLILTFSLSRLVAWLEKRLSTP
ncbi:MAG TPA: ABC transporter substrate-binding protein/permease, partial [Chthoniobacteraceae bacterium]|nr:ABC transporter substrate-binding protein/permease [Chthoniobacteraceae bacterium]